jgi:hypothetical protein
MKKLKCEHGETVFPCSKCDIEHNKNKSASVMGYGANMTTGLTLANSSRENKRAAADFYPTPPEVTWALLQELKLDPATKILEPACGAGHMAKEIEAAGYSVESTDLFDRGYGEHGIDFTKQNDNRGCNWMITNPPFNEAVPFIEKAASLQLDGFALLLKSQFWHAKKRLPIFEKYPPALVMPLTWRPDFCLGARGNSPTMDTLWTIWKKGDARAVYKPLQKPLALFAP